MMGVQPGELKRLTMWEFQAITEFWIETHPSDEPGTRLSEEEKDDLYELVQSRGMPLSHKKRETAPNGAGHRSTSQAAAG